MNMNVANSVRRRVESRLMMRDASPTSERQPKANLVVRAEHDWRWHGHGPFDGKKTLARWIKRYGSRRVVYDSQTKYGAKRLIFGCKLSNVAID